MTANHKEDAKLLAIANLTENTILSHIKNIFYIGFILFALTSIGSAATYYVRADGNDGCNGLTNAGTGSSPNCAWKTSAYALSQITAGNTLIYSNAGGIFYESAEGILTHSGDSTHWINIQTDGKGDVEIRGYATSGTAFRVDGRSYFNITGTLNSKFIMTNWFEVSSINNVQWAYFKNITAWGVVHAFVTGNPTDTSKLIHNVTFDNIYSNGSTSNAYEEIDLTAQDLYNGCAGKDGSCIQDITISNSYFDTSGHNGIDIHSRWSDALLENVTLKNMNSAAAIHILNYENHRITMRKITTIGGDSGIWFSGVKGAELDGGDITKYGTGKYGIIFYTQDISLTGVTRDTENVSDVIINNVDLSQATVGTAVMFYDNFGAGANWKYAFDNITFSNVTLGSRGLYFYGSGNPNYANNINFWDMKESSWSIGMASTGVNVTRITVGYKDNSVFKSSAGSNPIYYPNRSEQFRPFTTSGYGITKYPMTARPTSGTATVTVNNFDTSLSKGNILVNFTANTANNNNVRFTIGNLLPYRYYDVKRDNSLFTTTKQADALGHIEFDNSAWITTSRTFTVIESDVPIPIGSSAGTISDLINNIPIAGATITDGLTTTISNASGYFRLDNIVIGSHSITASKIGYQTASKTITISENLTTIVDFQLSPSIPPVMTSYTPNNTMLSQDEGTTNIFTVTVNQSVTNRWFLDGVEQSETSQSYTKTWSYSDSGTHNITYSGSNANGAVSKTWIITVVNFVDTTLPVITVLSPESRQYPTGLIPLDYYANEPITDCLVSVDGTINQSLPTCANISAISKEYLATSNTRVWYHFNENTGNSIQDSSGNAIAGTRNGALWTSGKFGSALQFNGLANYVEVPYSNILDGGNKITIEAWVKPVIGTRGSIVSKYVYNSTVSGRVYELDINIDGVINFGLSSNGTSSGTIWLSSTNVVSDNSWNHIVATSDGVTMKLYINGVLDPSMKSAPSTIHSYPYNLQIGAWKNDPSGTPSTYFNGLIDEVRILNRSLTDEEIKTDYALGAGNHNVVVYAKDISGNLNSATRYFTINLGLPDTTPPASVTSLHNITYAQSYINWTWIDPADIDLSKVMVYLGGAFQTNVSKGVRYYNATGLTAGTSYTISTKTFDTSGNINPAWVNHTATTSIQDTTILAGDVTGNGVVDAIDSLFISQYVAGTRAIMPNSIAGDVALPCGKLDGIDAMFVSQYVVGSRGSLKPCG